MNQLKTFWHVLINSFTAPSYYRKIIDTSFGFSMKFYLFYFFLFSVLITAIMTSSSILPFNQKIQKAPDYITQLYPDDLVLTIKNGELTSNVEEPYYYTPDLFNKLYDEDGLENTKENLLVIDTKGSISDIGKYNTAMLITKNYIMYPKNGRDYQYEVLSFKEVPDIVINEALVQKLSVQIAKYLVFAVPIMTLGLFFILFTSFALWNLVLLFYYALVLWLVSKITSIQVSYSKLYQIGLHMTVVIITLLFIIGKFMPITFPFLKTILFAIGGFIVLSPLKSAHSSKAKE